MSGETRRASELTIEALSDKGARLGPFEIASDNGIHVTPAPLTVFIGPQGSGKSLLMQLIFLGEAFPYLVTKFVSREEESKPYLLLRVLLDRLRRGDVRDKRRGFYSLLRRDLGGVRIGYTRTRPWRDYKGMDFRIYATRSEPRLEKDFKEWVQHLTANVDWREKWLSPLPAIFVPAERTFYSRFINSIPDILQNTALPLTMLSFTRTINLAMNTFLGWEDGKPTTAEAQWVWERARNALNGEAYLPPSGPHVWKWRLLDGTVHDLEMASSGQMEAWPLVLTAMCLFEWRKDGTISKDAPFYLFVEEPEAHLHPLAHLRILEILAYLVNHGIHVVLTTHSPLTLFEINSLTSAYQVRKFTNVKSYDSFIRKLGLEENSLPPIDSWLPPSKVAGYEVKGGRVQSLGVEEEEGWLDEERLRQAEWSAYSYLNTIQYVLEKAADSSGEAEK